jgi:hypothetical protein
MIPLDQIIPDDYADEAGRMILALNAMPVWNKQKLQFREELVKKLDNLGYITFSGHYTRYHLPRTGQSLFYDVPLDKKGFLKPFRGKRIRLVNVKGLTGGSSYYRMNRIIMAGKI